MSITPQELVTAAMPEINRENYPTTESLWAHVVDLGEYKRKLREKNWESMRYMFIDPDAVVTRPPPVVRHLSAINAYITKLQDEYEQRRQQDQRDRARQDAQDRADRRRNRAEERQRKRDEKRAGRHQHRSGPRRGR